MTFETKNIGGETPEQLSASPRLFESDLLDKLSRVHHLTPVIIYTPIILGLTIYSLTLQGSATVVLGLFVGYIAWTLTEYFGHRYLFHTVFALPLGLGPRFQFLIHGVHHIYPSDPLRLVMPPLLSAFAPARPSEPSAWLQSPRACTHHAVPSASPAWRRRCSTASSSFPPMPGPTRSRPSASSPC